MRQQIAIVCCTILSLQAYAQTSAIGDGQVLEQVIVTATKRDQSLQTVPLAVTALTDEALRARGADSFVDYARSVPSVSFVDLGVGRQRIAIRGIDSKIGSGVVGYYLDEAPVPTTSSYTAEQVAVDPKLGDVERIEILRGPQGTVYGAGSMGGTIKIVPKAPNVANFESFLSAALSSTNAHSDSTRTDVTGMVNIPLISDRLAFRTVAWYRNDQGFIERRTATPESRAANLATGAPIVFEDSDRVADEETFGVRAALGFHLNDRVTMQLSVFHQNSDFGGFQDITTGALNPNDDLVQNLLLDTPERNKNEITLANVKLEADLGFANLVSSFSYFDRSLSLKEETTEVLEFFGFVPNPFNVPIDEVGNNESFSAEVRLASKDAERLDWLVGVFYDENKGRPEIDWRVPGVASTFGLPTDNLITIRERSSLKQKAVFGELDFHVMENVTVTAGMRWFDATQYTQTARTGVFSENPDDSSIPDPATGLKLTGSSKDTIYKFGADWRLTPQAMVYALASEGFRPGFGVTQPPSFCADALAELGLTEAPTQVDPDKLWNYEVGAKTDWAGGRVRVNVAAFEIDWKNIQNSIFLDCGYPLTANLGDLRNRGVEVEVNGQFSSNVSGGVSTGYLDSSLQQDLLGIAGTKGKPLTDTPEWTGSAFLEATFPAFAGWLGTARTDLSYTSGSVSAYTANEPIVEDKGSLTLWDARLMLERKNVEVALFAQNILNDVERTALVRSVSINIPDRLRYSVNRPRTIGISATWRY